MSVSTEEPTNLATPAPSTLEHIAPAVPAITEGGMPDPSAAMQTPETTVAASHEGNSNTKEAHSTPMPAPLSPKSIANPASASKAAAASASLPSSPVTRSRASTAVNAEAGPSRTSPRSAAGRVKTPGQPKADAPLPPPRQPFLQPHHFSSLDNGARPPTALRSEWRPVYPDEEGMLSPEDDPMALRGIPVFHPTMEEFKDFEGYVTRTAPWGMRSGIVKVVPPAEWSDSLPSMDRRTLSQVQIKRPIQQNMMGSAGIYRAHNIEKNKSRALSVQEWFDKCQDDAFAPPSIKTYERDSKELKAAHAAARQEKAEREKRKKEEARAKREKSKSERMKREEDRQRLASQATEGADGMKHEVPELDPASSGSSRSSEPAKTPELEPLDPWYESVDLKTAWLPKNATEEDYTDEACSKLQEKYWKTMGLGEPSWYGADLMQGSLFADKNTPWNVAHLPNLLDRVKCVVPGVNEPYLYFGMWRATFAWHVEDMDLFSINYIHFGAPKYWYAIPQGQAEQLERFLANEFPIDSKSCDQFIRHKSMAISPSRLRSAGIRCNMLVHRQGEFVITYPKGYHAGFNMGFNCAESVNFALDSWIDYGRKAKHCRCVRDSVHIDVDKMLKDAEDAVAQPAGVKAAKRAKFMAQDQEAEGDEDVQENGVKERKRAPRKEKQERGEDEEAETPRKKRRTKKDRIDIAGEEGEAVQLQPIPAYMPMPDKRIIDIAQPEHFAPLDLAPPASAAHAGTPQPTGYDTHPALSARPPTIHPPPPDAPQADTSQLPGQASPFTLEPAPAAKKGRPRKSLVTAPAVLYPCLFCPSLNDADRAHVQEPNDFVKAQWRGGKGQPIMAHIRCAQATPEVAILDVDKADGQVEAWITGVNDIVKARWKLKCKACDAHNESTGVKVQCTKGKCVQAYHYTCAEQDDKITCNLWQVEQTFKQDEDVEDSPMVTDISLKLELLCPSHNPAQKAIREQEKLEDLKRQLLAMIPGQSIKLKMGPAATICRLVKVLEQEQMVEVDIEGVSQTLPWSKVDIKPTPAPKVVENEYARHHTHKRDGAPPTPVTASSTASLPAKKPRVAKDPKAKATKAKPANQDIASANDDVSQGARPRSSLPNLGQTPLPPITTAEVFHPARPSSVQSGSMQPPRSHSASAAGIALPPLMRSVPMHHRGTSDMAPPPPLGRPPTILPPPTSAAPYNPYPPHAGYAGSTESYGYPPYSAPHLGPPPVPHTAMPPPRSAPVSHPGQHDHHAPLPHAASLPGFYAPPPTSTRQVLHPSYPPPPEHNRVYVVDSHTQAQTPAYGYYDHQHPQHHYNLPPPQRSQYPTHPSGYQYGPPTYPSQGYHQGHLPSPGLPPPPVQHPAYVYAQPAEHGFTSMQPLQPISDVRRHSGGPSSYPPPSPVTPQGPPSSSTPYVAAPSGMMPSPAHFLPAPPTPGIDLGLERMRRIMSKLEPIRTPAIHLAGTNGKGSVSAMLESALMAAGLKVGRYNSPHLLEPRDAVRIDGQPVSADTYSQAMRHIERVGSGIELTNFEMATAAALDLLNRSRVDIMIIECGMGGARDATNVLPPDLVLATGLTAVGLDHTAFLGDTVEEITMDKAQIAVQGGIMVVGVQPFRAVYDVAAQVSQNRRAKLIYTLSARVVTPASTVSFKPFKAPTLPIIAVQVEGESGRFQDLPIRLPLLGSHQVDNLALVVTMLDALRKDDRACAVLDKLRGLTDDTIQRGIEQTRWEGRCSWLSHPHFGPVLLDGAHNADSAATLRRYIDSLRLSSKVPLTFVLGLSNSKGKSSDSVLAPLLHTGDGVAVVGFSPVDGMPWVSPVAKEVVERAATGLKTVHVYQRTGQPSVYARQGKLDGFGHGRAQMDELASALEWADKRGGLTVVCGSLYLVADAYRLLNS